jgi:hypothetical protein
MKPRKRSSGRGRTKSSYTVGLAGFAPISAVEGLHLTAAMQADFREFERKGLSSAERRRRIAQKYGGAR